MRRASPLRWVLAALALLGCRLDTSEKTACEDSSDCLGDRVCMSGQCSDDACPGLCRQYCSLAEDCGTQPSAACTDLCDVQPSPGRCKESFDDAAGFSCEDVACLGQCVEVCEEALSCALIEDVQRCIDGCWAWGYCPASATSCTDLPNVVCYAPDTPCT